MNHSDETFMSRAIELAALGKGSVSPNPLVGCVIAHENKIIGEGYHQKYGEAHAEVNAVKSVSNKDLLPRSTAFVTLEPCAHHGKTPPCADLLIDVGIKKVVIGSKDPFDRVDGKGIQKLKEAGIETVVGVLENKTNEQNRRFLTFHKQNRPYVILKWAQTADGFIARENFDSKWISNEKSRQLVHKWRAEEDAILVGKNTALYDNPSLTVRDWEGRNPTRILIDPNLEIDDSCNLLNEEAKTIIFNGDKEGEERSNKWIKMKDFSVESILNQLFQLKIQSIIIEGGAKTLNSFIENDCWDEARVFTATSQFEKGIEAPQIDGRLLKKESIIDDIVEFYRNEHGR